MLTSEVARACFEAIRDAELPVKLLPLRRDLYLKVIEYAHIRAQWQLAPREQRMEMDQRRTLAHNAFIDSCNIMSRNMGAEGEDNSWRVELRDDRKLIVDFACYIHCFLGIEAR